MKKIWFGVIPFAALLMLASCGDKHEHSYTKLAEKDKDGHWMECECKEKQRVNHEYGDWKVITEPTESSLGKKERICQFCQYTDSQDIEMLQHQHQFATAWIFDSTEHYHQATCGHDQVKGEAEKHQYKNGSCSTCGVSEDIQLFEFNVTATHAILTDLKDQGVVDLHLPAEYAGVPVQEIGSSVFDTCQNLENVYYEGSLEDWCQIRFTGSSSNPMYSGQHFFLKNDQKVWEEVTKLVIPQTVEAIGNHQFYGFENITEINMSHIKSIGVSAFSNCKNLKKVELPAITKLEHHTFSGCTGLEEIVIPNTVEEIGSSAFESCSQATAVTIPASVKKIGTQAFSFCNQLLTVYYTGTVEDWCRIAFAENDANPMTENSHFYIQNETNEYEELKSLVIPSTVTKINSNQFQNFTQLTSITLPNTIQEIGSYAFFNCSGITELVLPEGLESIGQNAFSNCDALKSVILPKSVKTVGNYCFLLCKNLMGIYYEGSKEEFEQANLNVDTYYVYYYAEEQPSERGKYWHYVDGVPTKWV